MKRIYRYDIPLEDPCAQIDMPRGAQIIHAHERCGVVAIWALVDPGQECVSREIRIGGTGWPLPDDTSPAGYIDTVHIGPFVWHLFDGGEVS